MNAISRWLVVVSTIAAAFFELYLAAPGFPPVVRLALGGAVAAVLGSHWAGRGVVAALLAVAYLAPAFITLWAGSDHFSFESAWLVPLVAVLVTGRGAARWSLPHPWGLPLRTGAAIVSLSWPIVALREVAFRPWILNENAANTSIGISPWEVNVWAVYLALGFNVGVLWFDALFRWFGAPDRRRGFERGVLLPMALAISIACVVGTYQGLVDLNFLNGHLWPHMRRASGTLMDANVFGTIAAMWGPVLGLLARAFMGRWSPAIAGAGLALSFLGVWTSGSRTALAVWLLGVAWLFAEAWRGWRARERRSSRPIWLAAAAGAAVVVAIGVLLARGSATSTVFARIPSLVPGMEEGTSVGSTLWQLWDRFGYGSAALGMIREHPVAGVGVGAFHALVHDYAAVHGGRDLPPDNAQNWWRHVVAEMGVPGALPWLAFTLLLLRAILTRRAGPDEPAARVLGGLLLAFGAISLLSMPSQSLPVALTFWTFVFWFLASAGRASAPAAAMAPPRRFQAARLLAAGLVVAHAVATFISARGELNPIERSVRFGWDYRAGLTGLERSADGTPGRRWTRARALTLVPVRGRVLKFVAWTGHPDANEHPIPVKVWADGALVYEGALTKENAFYVDIPAPTGRTHLVLETWIGRTFRPSDYGVPDRRVLGLAIQDWRWQ